MRERIQTYRNTLILGLIALPLGLAIGAIDALSFAVELRFLQVETRNLSTTCSLYNKEV